MPSKIRLDMRLDRLLTIYPETRQVFEAHNLGQMISHEALTAIGPFLTLETALLNHGIAPLNFLSILEEAVAPKAPLEAPDGLKENDPGPANLLALMTCGLKFPFSKALAGFMNDLQQKQGEQVIYSVVSNLNHEHSYYPYVNHIKTVDDLPDIIISSDFNVFFYHRFYKNYIQTGHFKDVMDQTSNDVFKAAGMSDPHGQYTILCVNPLVIVADLEKVGRRPLPDCWEDLLDPIWQRDITLRGNENFFCHAVLLPFYKDHGPAAIEALAKNVFDGRHPAQMVKSAGSGRGAALYVMPYFFSQKISEKRSVKLIWPKDGALASPVTLLVKKKRRDVVKPVVDYLVSEELARIFVAAHFPSPHSAIQNPLPVSGGLKWLGWDYIHANDLEEMNVEIDNIFLPIVAKGGAA